MEKTGATLYVGSDCYPYTVLSQSDSKITAQRDSFKAAPGSDYFNNQIWDIIPNPHAPIETYTLRKNGRWVKVGDNMHHGSCLSVGRKVAYRDPSF